jgi:hypothetical protein
VRLLLESALRLYGEFGGHDCGVCRSRKSWSSSVEFVDFEVKLVLWFLKSSLGVCGSCDFGFFAGFALIQL